MSVVKSVGRRFAGFAGQTGRLFGQGDGSTVAGYELAGIDVSFGEFEQDSDKESKPKPVSPASRKQSPEIFDIGALLRLRTFVYLILATMLFLFQIHNTLAIKELSKRNERLREQLRISTSISTSQELRARELQSIRYISAFAQRLGLDSPVVPPVELEP